MADILIVDDQPDICWALRKLAEKLGHQATAASSAEEMFQYLTHQRYDLIILDVRLPGMDGLAALRRIRESLAGIPVIVITAYGDLEVAVQAMQSGAFDYLPKPFTLETVAQAIRRALNIPPVVTESPAPVKPASAAQPALIGVSPAMQAVFKQIAMVADTDFAVHICGESGTGKELVARAIHTYSRRREKPFVVAHLAALSPTLVESELFGHVRGSFTGAEADHPGLLQQAQGGTLFIDEVADIPLNVQAKLLRALEYQEFTPVGGERPIRADFRLLSATHQNLRELVARGQFRHDLFYRLITFEIHIPPLRERPEDIEPLARHFIAEWAGQTGRGVPPWSDEFGRALRARPWWGNVRELKHALEHALIVSRGGVLHPDHLPAPLAPQPAPCDLFPALEEAIKHWVEKALKDPQLAGKIYEAFLRLAEPILFQSALRQHQGQYVGAARHLGIHRVTLKRKVEHYGLKPTGNGGPDELTTAEG